MEIDTSRLKIEDYLCLLASFLLLASIFLPWYSFNIGSVSGWDGTKITIIPMIVAILAALIVIAVALGIDFAEEYGVCLLVIGLTSFIAVIVKMYIRRTGLTITYGIVLATVASLVILGTGVAKLVRTNILRV